MYLNIISCKSNFPLASDIQPIRITDDFICFSGILALSSNLQQLFLSEEDSDITIKVENQQYRVHKNIVRARSPVFYAMLSHDMAEKNKNFVDIPDCDPHIFRDFLFYLYAGKLDTISSANVFELYRISDKYDVKELRMDCVEYILQNLSVDVIGDVIDLATKHHEKKVLKRATKFFVDNAKEILPSVNWMKFVEKHPIEANELYIKAYENH